MTTIVEICVDSLEDAVAAAEGGADRLELCARLDLEGLTPPVDVVRRVARAVRIPVLAMVRPRPGDYFHTSVELETMERQADGLLDAGAEGLVFGALRRATGASGTSIGGMREVIEIDDAACRRLLARHRGCPAVFHRAFDQIADPLPALDRLADLGFTRVLTSGGHDCAASAYGIDALARLIRHAAGRIEILPGGGIRAENVRELVRGAGCNQVHSSCRVVVRHDRRASGEDVARFCAAAVRALRRAVDELEYETR